MRKAISMLPFLVLLTGLGVTGFYNALLFHSLTEGFSVVIACGAFMVTWNTRRFANRNDLLLIGVAYLFVGFLDVVHTLVYTGMNVIPGYGPNTATQLWIAARYMEALTLLAAPFILTFRIKDFIFLLVYAAASVLVLMSVFIWRTFPDCFLPGIGLTPFKIASEYAIATMLAVAGALFVYFKERFDADFLRWIVWSIAATASAEIVLTTYASVYDPAIILGHLLKIFSFYLIYKAVIETGLSQPFMMLFADLQKQNEASRVILNSILDAVIAVDEKGCISFINPMAETLTGWTEEAARDQPLEKVFRTIMGKGGVPLADTIQSVLRDGYTLPLASQKLLNFKDGSSSSIEFSLAPLKAASGAITGVVVVFRDISNRIEMVEALQQSEQRLRLALDAASAVSFEWDIQRDIINRFSTSDPVLGATKDEHPVSLATVYEAVHPDDRHRFAANVDDAKQRADGRYENEYRVIHPDGKIHWLIERGQVISDESERPQKLIGLSRDITERKLAESSLRESEALLQLFIQHAPVALAMFDKEMRYLSHSHRWITDYGLEGQNILGRSHYDVFPEIPEHWKASHRRCMEGQAVESEEGCFARPDGTIQWLRWAAHPWREGDGRVGGIVLFREDITIRKKVQTALQRYELLSNNTRDILLYIAYPSGRILEANLAATVAYRYSYNEMLSLNIRDLRDEKTRPVTVEQMKIAFENGHRFKTVHRRKDGSLFPVEVSSQGANIEGVQTLVSIVRDITEQEKALEAIKQHNSLLEGINQIFATAMTCESEEELLSKCLTIAEKVTESMFGFIGKIQSGTSLQHVIISDAGREWCTLSAPKGTMEMHEAFDLHGIARRVILESRTIISNDPAFHPDSKGVPEGHPPLNSFLGAPLIHGNRPMGIVALANRDGGYRKEDAEALTSLSVAIVQALMRKRAEMELQFLNETLEDRITSRTELAETRARQLQALAVELTEAEEKERQRIAQLLHDDLQQILASARMQLEAVCQKSPEEKSLVQIERLLSESIRKSRYLSQELSPPVLYHTGLVEALEWLAGQFKSQFGLQVELIDNGCPNIENGFSKIFSFRAVQELLFNVVKHASVGMAAVRLSAADSALRITVSDNGAGFNAASPKLLQTSAGFGLLSLYERARHIGGNLSIDSAPGKGSRLTVTVPLGVAEPDIGLSAARVPLSEMPERSERNDRHDDIRILLVDDHKVMRQGLVQMIQTKPSLRVVGEAATGVEAIELTRILRPDVVVMDVSMPEMDGVEATRRIKKEWPEVTVVGLSMSEDEQVAMQMRDAGAEAFVNKAVSTAELLEAIYGLNGSAKGG